MNRAISEKLLSINLHMKIKVKFRGILFVFFGIYTIRGIE